MQRCLVPLVLVSILVSGCGRGSTPMPYPIMTLKQPPPPEPAPADALVLSNDVADFDSLSTQERNQILDALLSDILKHPRHEHVREFYGSQINRVVLVTNTNYGIPWPDDYQPRLPAWGVTRAIEGEAIDLQLPRRLGVRIDRFALRNSSTASSPLDNAPIAVTVFNAGGTSNDAAIGGCLIYFDIKRVDGTWCVEFAGAEDP